MADLGAASAAAGSEESESGADVGVDTTGLGRMVAVGEGNTAGIAVACRPEAVLASAHPTAAGSANRASKAIHNLITIELYQFGDRDI